MAHHLNTGRNGKVGELREVPSLILRWLYRQVPFFCPHRKRGCSTCCRGNNCTVIRAPGGTGFRQYVCTALGVRCGEQHANSLPTNWLLKRSEIRVRHSCARFTVLATVSSGMPMFGTTVSEELGASIFRGLKLSCKNMLLQPWKLRHHFAPKHWYLPTTGRVIDQTFIVLATKGWVCS